MTQWFGIDLMKRDLQTGKAIITMGNCAVDIPVISEFVPLETFSNPKALNFNLYLTVKRCNA